MTPWVRYLHVQPLPEANSVEHVVAAGQLGLNHLLRKANNTVPAVKIETCTFDYYAGPGYISLPGVSYENSAY